MLEKLSSVIGRIAVGVMIGGLIAVIIIPALIIGGAFSERIGEEHMRVLFVEDYELLRATVDYLIDSGDTSIHFWTNVDNRILIENLEKNISNDSDNMARTIQALSERGYISVTRNENIIIFLRSSRRRNFGNGIVYSIDGVLPNYGLDPSDSLYSAPYMHAQILFLTRLELLSMQNWFYYEEDFREWRLRYRN